MGLLQGESDQCLQTGSTTECKAAQSCQEARESLWAIPRNDFQSCTQGWAEEPLAPRAQNPVAAPCLPLLPPLNFLLDPGFSEYCLVETGSGRESCVLGLAPPHTPSTTPSPLCAWS